MKTTQGMAFVLGMFVFSAALPAYAAYEVQDPNGLLGQLDQYLSSGSFDQGFQVGDVANYTRLHKDCYMGCGADGCSAICTNASEAMTRTVSAANASQATITLDDGTTQVWTSDQFSSLHGNAVRYDLPLLDFQYAGYLEASTLAPRSYTTPSGKVIDGMEIVFLFRPQGHEDDPSEMVRYTVSRDYPVAGQILQMAAFGMWFYQQTDVSRALSPAQP